MSDRPLGPPYYLTPRIEITGVDAGMAKANIILWAISCGLFLFVILDLPRPWLGFAFMILCNLMMWWGIRIYRGLVKTAD